MPEKITWKSEKRNIKELKPFPGNPRKADEKEVADLDKSLERFDLAAPLIINQDGTVIGGNFRLSRLIKKGRKIVDVRVPNRLLTRKEAEELNLRLNKNQGSWDFDVLANFGEGLLKDIGFESEELDKIFQLGENEDIDEVPELPKKPKTKLGELYQLGKHRLMCGDSTKKEDVERLMDGNRVDMVFTDPPYGLGGYAGRSGKFKPIEGDNLDVKKFYDCIPVNIKERYIWGGFPNFVDLVEMPRDVIVWKKNNFGMGKGYRGQYELCFYYGKFKGNDTDVWEVNRDTKYKHPISPFSVPLMQTCNPRIF